MKPSLLLGLLLWAAPAHAQLQGVVANPARQYLSARWGEAPSTVEHMYCVTRWSTERDGYIRVEQVIPAKLLSKPSPDGVTAVCQDRQPAVHTHPPTTCSGKQCSYGGEDAWLCAPSNDDWEALIDVGAPFDIVQCDRNAFVFFRRPGS